MLVESRGPPTPRRRTPESLKGNSSWFPEHRVRKHPRRLRKPGRVCGKVQWHDAIADIIHTSCIAPAADFNIHFAIVLVSSRCIKRVSTENRCGLELRNVVHRESVSSVSETAGLQNHRARPLFTLLADA